MKIVFFVYRYWPSVGGVEKYVHELGKALYEMGHTVDVVAGTTTDGLAAHETYEGIRIHRFPAHRSPLRSRFWLLRHLHLFARADVVHVSNTHMLEYLWRMLGGLIDQRKVFLTRHGMSYDYPVPVTNTLRAKRSLHLAAGVIHDGRFIEKWLGVPPDRCPDQGLTPEASALPYVPEPPPDSAVFVGRIEQDSGIEIYIDAVRRLTQDAGISFRLDVYGGGTHLPAMRRMADDQNLPIRFHGRVANAQKFITDACFAFIDGRMAIQEAMARRRLVLAGYPNPLKRDYVAGEAFGPYLVPVGSGAELTDRVLHYISHPDERAELVRRAYDHACTLRWSRTAEAYLSLWRERLESPRRRCSRLNAMRLTFAMNRARRRNNGWCPRGLLA